MRILISFGTRPEYIKVKSLIDNLPKHNIEVKTVFTGQHMDLLKNINHDYSFDIIHYSNNRLNDIICSIMKYSDIFKGFDYVLVQGDTTSALAIALSSFNNGIKVIHLEAGMRTFDKYNPFPEEMNRKLISSIAEIHLCATENNKNNLIKENILNNINVVGNTGLDNIDKSGCHYGNIVLVTMHRRENHDIIDQWFKELSKIAEKYSDLEFVIPLHPNPNIQKHKNLLKNIKIIDSLCHKDMIDLMKKTRFVISDSGGLQEEASFLNKKIVICRKVTERTEILGTHGILCKYPSKLENIISQVYNNYKIDKDCPFGDGYAWKKILKILEAINILE